MRVEVGTNSKDNSIWCSLIAAGFKIRKQSYQLTTHDCLNDNNIWQHLFVDLLEGRSSSSCEPDCRVICGTSF